MSDEARKKAEELASSDNPSVRKFAEQWISSANELDDMKSFASGAEGQGAVSHSKDGSGSAYTNVKDAYAEAERLRRLAEQWAEDSE